jgi:hypothetical protein
MSSSLLQGFTGQNHTIMYEDEARMSYLHIVQGCSTAPKHFAISSRLFHCAITEHQAELLTCTVTSQGVPRRHTGPFQHQLHQLISAITPAAAAAGLLWYKQTAAANLVYV